MCSTSRPAAASFDAISRCFIPGCRAPDDVPIHLFPPEGSRERLVWLEWINQDGYRISARKLKETALVCSLHFHPSSYSSADQLKPEAVPSIFPWTPEWNGGHPDVGKQMPTLLAYPSDPPMDVSHGEGSIPVEASTTDALPHADEEPPVIDLVDDEEDPSKPEEPQGNEILRTP